MPREGQGFTRYLLLRSRMKSRGFLRWRITAIPSATKSGMPFFIMEADEFNFTDEQERQWIQDHLDGPGKLALVAEVSGESSGS